ncbi:MAG: WecB/TagA/CpsF family glycosyltransferase [Armatimonadetes bacterium]|nr:WecB/TagA/CpsF family glycosyltransferase [Armatimonadota bacterium]
MVKVSGITELRALGVKVHSLGMDEAVRRLEEFMKSDRLRLVITLGTEMVIRAEQDAEFRRLVDRADLVVPDGIGLVLASRYCGLPMPERVAGIDLIWRLSRELRPRLFLLGAAPGVAEQAADRLRQNCPGLEIVGVQDGYFSDEEEVVARIAGSGADVLLVGIGSPRQEQFIDRHRDRLGVAVGIGVGGSFDVLAGRLRRAPEWMIRLGLEWLYRLVSQPSRCLRMLALPKFLWRVLLAGRGAVTMGSSEG